MKYIVLSLLVWGMLTNFCQQASAERLETLGKEPIESLNVTMVPGNGKFMVIDSRMTETATAAVLAGIIGAGINSAINADEDDKKAEPYKAAAGEIDVAGLVETSLRETLARKDFPTADAALASHVLTVEVKDWGLSRVAFDRADVAVFLKVSVVMKNGKIDVWDAYVKESGRTSGFLSETTPERFSQDMRQLASKTGKRIAYEIIYR